MIAPVRSIGSSCSRARLPGVVPCATLDDPRHVTPCLLPSAPLRHSIPSHPISRHPAGTTSSIQLQRDVRRLVAAYAAFNSGWPQPDAERLSDSSQEPPLQREADVGRIPDARVAELAHTWNKGLPPPLGLSLSPSESEAEGGSGGGGVGRAASGDTEESGGGRGRSRGGGGREAVAAAV